MFGATNDAEEAISSISATTTVPSPTNDSFRVPLITAPWTPVQQQEDNTDTPVKVRPGRGGTGRVAARPYTAESNVMADPFQKNYHKDKKDP